MAESGDYNNLAALVQQALQLPPAQAEAVLASASHSTGEGEPDYGLVPAMATPEGGNDCMYVDRVINTMPPPVRRPLPLTPPQKAALQKAEDDRRALGAHVQKANTFMDGLQPTRMSGTFGLEQRQYLLEKEDKKHRMGDILQLFFNEYKREPTNLDFFDWVDQQTYFRTVQILQNSGYRDPENVRAFAPAFLRGVKYMGKVERASYRVKIEGGKLMRNGAPFDTAGNSTIFSGMGWAIWVMSPGGFLYSGDHKKGELQHSGFLDGGNVKGAGEWQVTNGVVRVITGKSGHYKCSVESLHTAVSSMFNEGLALQAATVYLSKVGRCETLAASTFLGMNASDRSQYGAVVSPSQLPFNKVDPPKIKPKFMGMSSHRVTVAPPAFSEHRQS